MNYNFDEVINRKGTNAIKVSTSFIREKIGKPVDDDTIHLWVADMDYACSKPIIDAIHTRANARIFGYTTLDGDDEYYEAIINYFKRHYDVTYDRQSIVYTPGTVFALNHLVKSLTKQGDGIIIQRPVYHPFTAAVKGNKRRLLNNALINEDGNYRIDFKGFEKLAKENTTKMFILCNPHNPVGKIWDKEALEKLVSICIKHDVILVADEIHADIRREGIDFYPVQSISDHKNIITCTAINKAYNTAGLHCSNIIVNDPDYRRAFKKSIDYPEPSPFAIPVLKAAYNESLEWLNQMNAYVDENFLFLNNFINTHLDKVKMNIAEGTYLAWLDFSAYGLSSEELDKIMIEDANVFVQLGEKFGEEGMGYIRVNVASSRSVLIEAMKRIEKALRNK